MAPRAKIPAFRLVPEPIDEAGRRNPPGFKWAIPPVGERHQLGGDPDFIQTEERPVCHQCGEEMTFYAQIDSLNDEVVLGDVGMIYVFVCFDCLEVQAILQTH
jgi:hypothetical protein